MIPSLQLVACGPCRDAYNEHERAKALQRRLAEGRG